MHCCLSLVYLRTLYTSVRVCRCVCSVMLPFPALGMFKASRCAVRMCLSLFSKNTCSAFYQWAALDWTGAVQGCAQITKHQQILIHPDWNWFGVFAELVWFGLAGRAGISVLSAADWHSSGIEGCLWSD